MIEITNDRHFLLILEINLFPEINPNTTSMIEQVMNAFILTHHCNIQCGINKVITLEKYCQSVLEENYLVVLKKIKPMLEESNIDIAVGEEVRGMYPKYHKTKKFYGDIGKQNAMNTEFALEKKLSYNGKKIKWESTYIDWISSILNESHISHMHNTKDDLIYKLIEPKIFNNFVETREIILNETERYAEKYREFLQLQREKVQ